MPDPTPRFDTLFPEHLNGTVTKFEIVDEDLTPNRVLELTRDWKIDTEWHLTGTGVDSLGGKWHVRVNLESMGDGYEGPIGPEVIVNYRDFDAGASTPTHCHWKLPAPITVTAAEMQGIPNLITGVYRPTLLITYENDNGHLRPMAGFREHALITLFQPND